MGVSVNGQQVSSSALSLDGPVVTIALQAGGGHGTSAVFSNFTYTPK
jgi:hypothetical protein